MNALQQLARDMRSYAFAHPWSPLAGIASLDAYRRHLAWCDLPLVFQLTHTRFGQVDILQLSFSSARGQVELPPELIQEIRQAFYRAEESPQEVPQATREEAAARLGVAAMKSLCGFQFIAWNPQREPEE